MARNNFAQIVPATVPNSPSRHNLSPTHRVTVENSCRRTGLESPQELLAAWARNYFALARPALVRQRGYIERIKALRLATVNTPQTPATPEIPFSQSKAGTTPRSRILERFCIEITHILRD